MLLPHRLALLTSVALAALTVALPAAAKGKVGKGTKKASATQADPSAPAATPSPLDAAFSSDTDTSLPVVAPALNSVNGDDEMAPMAGSTAATTSSDPHVLAVEPKRAPRLLTKQFVLSVGGALSVTFERSIPKEKVANDFEVETGGALAVVPNVGLFVIDNLELQVAFDIEVPFGRLYDKSLYSSQTKGFELGARYLFDLGSVFLYAGMRLGFATQETEIFGYKLDKFGQVDNDANGMPMHQRKTYKQRFLTFGVPLGVLVPLNSYVALDAGLRVDFDISLDDDGISYIRNPWGFFGVQGFFSPFSD